MMHSKALNNISIDRGSDKIAGNFFPESPFHKGQEDKSETDYII